jgi:hypothetical protein
MPRLSGNAVQRLTASFAHQYESRMFYAFWPICRLECIELKNDATGIINAEVG